MSDGFLPTMTIATVGITISLEQRHPRSMSRPKLEAASDALHDAADVASPPVADDLTGKAETVADLATRSEGPDHGRLARLEHALRELVDEGSDDVAERVERALDHVRDYRKTVEGV